MSLKMTQNNPFLKNMRVPSVLRNNFQPSLKPRSQPWVVYSFDSSEVKIEMCQDADEFRPRIGKSRNFRGVNKLRPEFSVTFAEKNKLPKTFGISVCDTFPVFYGTNDVKTFFRVLPTKMIGLMKRRSAINQSVIEWCSVTEWGNQWTMMKEIVMTS